MDCSKFSMHVDQCSEEEEKAMESSQSTVSKAPFHVPIELAIEILSKSPVKSLLRFKSVCKSWYALIESPEFISKHLTHSNLDSTTLLLITRNSETRSSGMYLHYYNNNNNNNNDDVCDVLINLDFPFLNEVHDDYVLCILGICNGLVCLKMADYGPLFICNPVTRQFREIPDYKWWDDGVTEIELVTYGFGFHPSIDDYILIRIMHHFSITDDDSEPSVTTDMYTMGTDSWRKLDVNMPSDFYPCGVWDSSTSAWYSSTPAFLNGVLYWKMAHGRSDNYMIASQDLDDEEFRLIRMPECLDVIFARLVELKDKLALINYPLGKRFFDVWVLNEDRISWTNQFRVGPFADLVGCLENGAITLVGCAKNGELVLKVGKIFGGVKFYLYDSKIQGIKNLPFDQDLSPSRVYMYVETLLTVKKND